MDGKWRFLAATGGCGLYICCPFATSRLIPFNQNTHALIDAVDEVPDDEDMKFQERTALQFGMIDERESRTNRVGERVIICDGHSSRAISPLVFPHTALIRPLTHQSSKSAFTVDSATNPKPTRCVVPAQRSTHATTSKLLTRRAHPSWQLLTTTLPFSR